MGAAAAGTRRCQRCAIGWRAGRAKRRQRREPQRQRQPSSSAAGGRCLHGAAPQQMAERQRPAAGGVAGRCAWRAWASVRCYCLLSGDACMANVAPLLCTGCTSTIPALCSLTPCCCLTLLPPPLLQPLRRAARLRWHPPSVKPSSCTLGAWSFSWTAATASTRLPLFERRPASPTPWRVWAHPQATWCAPSGCLWVGRARSRHRRAAAYEHMLRRPQ